MPTQKTKPKRDDAATRRAILNHLKMNGPAKAVDMAQSFNLTAMAIRLHLYDLEKQGVVGATAHATGRGRPSKHWHLTAKAEDAFPDSHRDLAVELLGAARTIFGEDGVAKLVDKRGKGQIKRYKERMGKSTQLEDRLKALAAARTEEGYMAQVERDGDEWLFVENHCPICTMARDCTGLCSNELEVFQKSLGTDYSISRAEHIISGDRRCAYRVAKR